MNTMSRIREYLNQDLLKTNLNYIIRNNDIKGLNELISSPYFSSLPKEQIETIAFDMAYLKFEKDNNKIIQYLIIDYGIKEELSINLIKGEINPIVKQMFLVRTLKSELSSELDSNQQSNKRQKI
jgi:hypothetical protein